jgi:hypothetical protein
MGRVSSAMLQMVNTAVAEKHDDIVQRTWKYHTACAFYTTDTTVPIILNHGYYVAFNYMVTVDQQTERGLERRKEGNEEGMRRLYPIVVPSQYLYEVPKQNKGTSSGVCGPANVRTFQIQVQDVTSDQPFQRYNTININPSTTK